MSAHRPRHSALATDPRAVAVAQAVLDAVSTPAAVLDARGLIVARNEAWEALQAPGGQLGVARGLVGTLDSKGGDYEAHLAAVDGPLKAPAAALRQAIRAARGGGTPAPVPYATREPGGPRDREAHARRVLGLAGLVLVEHADVTDRLARARAEERALSLGVRLEAMSSRARRQDELLHAMGHEVNGPITAVNLQLHLLASGAKGPLAPQQAAALGVLARNLDRWARVSAAYVLTLLEEPSPAQPEAFDLREVVEALVRERRSTALKQGVALELRQCKPALPVHADLTQVRDVLRAYLDHSFGAAYSGARVRVETRLQHGECVVEVRDTGSPATDAEVAACFLPWAAGGEGEAGLRLYRCRLLAEAAGGRAFAQALHPGVALGVALPVRTD